MNQCTAAGCGNRQAAGYSRFCNKHAKRLHRHGHYAQQGITRERLKPHTALVLDYVARRGGEDVWAKLEAVWDHAVKAAKGKVAEALSGRPHHRHEAAAAREFVRVAESAPARSVIATAAAMAILWHREPGAFRCDRAAWIQTARRVRCLSSQTKRRYVCVKDGRVKTVTRDLHSEVAALLGRMLQEALGMVGLKIMEGAWAEHQERGEANARAYFALRPVEAQRAA